MELNATDKSVPQPSTLTAILPATELDATDKSMTCPVSLIRFCTYNCQGWRSGSEYVSALLNSLDFCLIQEHWLLSEHLGALDISDEFISIGVSGMDSSNLLVGRPYGGCAILCRKSLSSSIRMLNCCSKQFCAVSLLSTNAISNYTFNTLIINAYLRLIMVPLILIMLL